MGSIRTTSGVLVDYCRDDSRPRRFEGAGTCKSPMQRTETINGTKWNPEEEPNKKNNPDEKIQKIRKNPEERRRVEVLKEDSKIKNSEDEDRKSTIFLLGECCDVCKFMMLYIFGTM